MLSDDDSFIFSLLLFFLVKQRDVGLWVEYLNDLSRLTSQCTVAYIQHVYIILYTLTI